MYITKKFVAGIFSGPDSEYAAIRKMIANRERKCSVAIREELIQSLVKLAKKQMFWFMMGVLFAAIVVAMVLTYTLNKSSMSSDIAGFAFSVAITALLCAGSFAHMSGLVDGPDQVSMVKLRPSSEAGKVIADYRVLCSGKHPTDHSDTTFRSLSQRAEEVCLRMIRSILSIEKAFADGFYNQESERILLKDKDNLNVFHRRHSSYGLLSEDLGILYDLVRKEGTGGEGDFQI